MSTTEDYADGRTKTIIGMAVSFTSMLRVFRKGSGLLIEEMIGEVVRSLRDIHDQRQFNALHEQFCERFISMVCLAKPKNSNAPASYGHAAKVLDVALKACVEFCQLPDPRTSERVRPFLHAGIDTPILQELKKSEARVTACTICGIDREAYRLLQSAVARQIEEEFGGTILPVMYDNILWRRLNRVDG